MSNGATRASGGGRRYAGRRLRVNDEITASRVFLVAADGVPVGETPVGEAMERASKAGCDLIEVQPGAELPVCRIGHRAELAEIKAVSPVREMRTVRMFPGVSEADFRLKIAHGKAFLASGGVIEAVVPIENRAERAAVSALSKRISLALGDAGRADGWKRTTNEYIAVFAPCEASQAAERE
jgi:translation initiation factor IF-3